MKLYKLIAHQKNFSEEELILSQKDFPNIKVKDIVEIYHPEYEGVRLLLQVQCLKDDMQTQKDTISVEQSIVSMFQLQIFSDVCVHVVDPASVALDSLELTFKDQYMGRSDMWRLKDNLTGSCVYTNKKVEFCHKSVRCQVYEMWAQGERVACGVVTDDTKIVFRSSTSQVYLFLQMSSEMWDFDIYGDLYFEKAVNGFLTELFAKWKRQGCNHEVTIVLFSRVFYEADSLDDFPDSMRACLQQDYRLKFYEDFYRVAVQSERLDDWACILPQLKRLFHNWQTSVLAYHQQAHPDLPIPKGINSCAAQGNFLEVLNMSLNVFEKHYLDRSFDRTGQLSIVITPGVGVFEVDRELTNITKQRIIDNGVGSDLVCVGEQPLHAVPLLQFHNKVHGLASNDFSMPHWINLSFYSSSKKVGYSTFVPRIKMAPIVNRPTNKNKSSGQLPYKMAASIKNESSLPNSVFDYDAYDAKVFAIPATRANKVQTLMRETRHRKGNPCADVNNRFDHRTRNRRGRTSENELPSVHPGDGLSCSLVSASLLSSSLIKSASMAIPKRSADDSSLLSYGSTAPHLRVRRPSGSDEVHDERKFNPYRTVIGSAGSPCGRGSSQMVFPFDSNIRQVKTGRALVNPFDPSHVTIKLTSNRRRWTHIFPKGPTGVLIQQHHFQAGSTHEDDSMKRPLLVPQDGKNESGNKGRQKPISRTSTLLWGATGEQEWTPALTTGVDWKSLTIPACLPITTDYFPDQRSLQNDFVVSDYSMIPDDVNADYGQQRASGRRPLETQEVFRELISQRLAQGFQLIILPSNQSNKTNEYLLSIGRIFHKIVLKGSTITVTGYRPRHPYPTFRIHYRYRLQTPDHETYDVSWVDFNAEKLENYNWNHLDHYICTRGDRDFALTESLKYWRLRLLILPNNLPDSPYTERVMRFLELCVNRIKRQSQPKKSMRPVAASGFRDRGGSNRVQDRPRLSSFVYSSERKIVHQYPIGDSGVFLNHQPSMTSHSDENLEFVKVRITSGSTVIVEAMKSPNGGLNFLDKSNNLPALTFVSYEAISWVLEHVEGVATEKDAIDLMKTLLNEKFICHSSGDRSIGFIYGFYLYTFVGDGFTPGVVVDNFDLEWAEVRIATCDPMQLTSVPAKHSFLETDPEAFSAVFNNFNERWRQMLGYRTCNLDMDIGNKSNRIEWGHLRYQSVFYPDASLEFIFQWVVCTGPLVAELVQNWLRKAQNCGINLVPMLCDPFALPLSHKADPLRASIFVPLNVSVLSIDGQGFLDKFPRDTWTRRLLLFQESIVRHFGFLPCSPDPASPSVNSSDKSSPALQFIHTSGTSFLLILNPNGNEPDAVPPSPQRSHRTSSNWLPTSALTSPTDGPHSLNTNYITRHVVNRHKWQQNQQIRVGFLWSWNFMLSKRWRSSSSSGDEAGAKLLVDFRKFCANENDRLKTFWTSASHGLTSAKWHPKSEDSPS